MTFIDFLATNGNILEFALKLFITIISIGCAVLVYVKTKNLDKTFITFKECMSMVKDTSGKSYSQDFTGSNIKKEYRYNKQTGEIEETGGTIDIQELINSCMETCLENVLARFMPVETQEQTAVAEHTRLTDRLDEMAKIVETSNAYKEAYGLDPKLSVEEVYSYIGKEAEKLKVAIDIYSDLKKGVELKDEKKDVEQESK